LTIGTAVAAWTRGQRVGLGVAADAVFLARLHPQRYQHGEAARAQTVEQRIEAQFIGVITH